MCFLFALGIPYTPCRWHFPRSCLWELHQWTYKPYRELQWAWAELYIWYEESSFRTAWGTNPARVRPLYWIFFFFCRLECSVSPRDYKVLTSYHSFWAKRTMHEDSLKNRVQKRNLITLVTLWGLGLSVFPLFASRLCPQCSWLRMLCQINISYWFAGVSHWSPAPFPGMASRVLLVIGLGQMVD